MTGKISRWGIGPIILLSSAAYAVLAGLATWQWPDVCCLPSILGRVLSAMGIALLAIGVPMLVIAARAATLAYNSDRLATDGIFGIVRNPIYSAWIVFILPGLALMSGSWPLFLTPAVAYFIFKATIRRENDYLEQRFGEAYREYNARVNELAPFPRLK